tara:strand:- start:3767 stop:4204 length:438 start_codon:yes stop_codon:yes gene_type:complete
MEAQFRPFSMAITLAGDEVSPSSVTLRDTAGTALKSNFISVEASGENGDAYFSVAIDPGDNPASLVTPKSLNVDASTAMGSTLSGICGGFASVNKGVVEYLLSDADRASIIAIQLDQIGACNFFITYGQVQHGNPGRDNLRPIGD